MPEVFILTSVTSLCLIHLWQVIFLVDEKKIDLSFKYLIVRYNHCYRHSKQETT